MTKLDFLKIEFKEFCDDNNLEFISADDLLCEDLPTWQQYYLKDFIVRWEKAQEISQEYARAAMGC